MILAMFSMWRTVMKSGTLNMTRIGIASVSTIAKPA